MSIQSGKMFSPLTRLTCPKWVSISLTNYDHKSEELSGWGIYPLIVFLSLWSVELFVNSVGWNMEQEKWVDFGPRNSFRTHSFRRLPLLSIVFSCERSSPPHSQVTAVQVLRVCFSPDSRHLYFDCCIISLLKLTYTTPKCCNTFSFPQSKCYQNQLKC